MDTVGVGVGVSSAVADDASIGNVSDAVSSSAATPLRIRLPGRPPRGSGYARAGLYDKRDTTNPPKLEKLIRQVPPGQNQHLARKLPEPSGRSQPKSAFFEKTLSQDPHKQAAQTANATGCLRIVRSFSGATRRASLR